MKNVMRGATFIEVIVLMVILGMVFLVFVAPFLPWHLETGRGEHTGYITAVERSGIIWKTGTAYVKSETESSQEDLYCVTSPEVEKALNEARETKALVTIKYLTWLNSGVMYCNGEEAVIYEVERI